jgi:hypothetical protein
MKRKLKQISATFSLGALFLSSSAFAATAGSTGVLNYRWMNAVINKTPVVAAACPEINTDLYGSGFQVTSKRSFFGNVAAVGSKWFPKDEIWSSVGVGPVKNDFSLISSTVDRLSDVDDLKDKRLPNSFDEVNRWRVSDSAYWEDEGGVSLYVGAGISPIDIGIFTIATGGWTNFLQKTGPNRVYVERQKKKMRSVNFGVGIGRPSVGVEKSFANQKGYAYEFVLDNHQNIEAFERFMAGDMTKAQDLEKKERSGVSHISSLEDTTSGWSRAFGISTPFIPILSFKASTGTSYSESQESTVWDEQILKDTGAYVKQRNVFLAGKQLNESRTFYGGKIVKDAPSVEGRLKTEAAFGNFKYAYQSNWGQEKRLRKYVNKVKALTGITSETCARVPSFDDTMGFNQVVLEMNWSDEYIQEIAGLRPNSSSTNFLKKIKAKALKYSGEQGLLSYCSTNDDDQYDEACSQVPAESVNTVFANLETYAKNMKKAQGDRKEFAKNLTKFGQEVWKSPFVFKAFYERGKLCGQQFRFEVSGARLTRHSLDNKYTYSSACVE